MNTLLSPLLGLGGWEAYALVGALCFGEAALFVGFVLPGETAVVLGGVLASEHHVSLSWICTLVVVCAIVGDSVGYEVGRRFGPYLLAHRPLQGHPGVERTREFLQRRGAYAVFVGRFAAVFRALVPGVAGASEVRYRTFLAANAAGRARLGDRLHARRLRRRQVLREGADLGRQGLVVDHRRRRRRPPSWPSSSTAGARRAGASQAGAARD